MHQIQQAAIKALLYSDIFDYPLTQEEIWEYAISPKPFALQSLSKAFTPFSATISQKKSFFFLSGKENIYFARLQKRAINERKIQKARLIAEILARIPTIKFIGISGSVAMKNAGKEDDIDLFFITRTKSVWISRLFVMVILAVYGVRRKKKSINVHDTICANMFIAEDDLRFPQVKRSLYLAHEIAQMLPLFSVDYVYKKFLTKNSWIATYLPNWRQRFCNEVSESFLRKSMASLMLLFESIVRQLQIMYMKKDRTTETISASVIAFHPHDLTESIEKAFAERCRQYDL
jgi:hypothetical protein